MHVLEPVGQADALTLEGAVTIGRSESCELQLVFEGISRLHARIEHDGSAWILRDLDSTNGTLLNGRRISYALLQDGDEIAVGPARILFRHPLKDSPDAFSIFQDRAPPKILASLPAADTDRDFLPSEEVTDPEVLRRDYDKLRLSLRLSREIGSEQSVGELSRRILDFCLEILPAAGGVVLLGDPVPEEEWKPRAIRAREEGLALSTSVLRVIREKNEALLIRDATSSSRFGEAASIQEARIRSLLAVPLRVAGRLRGCLYLESREVAIFEPKDLHLLAGVASQAALAIERVELVDRIRSDAVVRAQLSRFLSPTLVDEIQEGRLALEKGGRIATVTVLFSDIRGFTGISEALGPERTLEVLNDYFEEMVALVFAHEGTIDKFIGDALMAVWGLPGPRSGDAERAVRCALAMQARARAFDTVRPVTIGIGLHSGPALVGLLGSSRRLEYTVIGDTVNLSWRLCSRARPGEIVTTPTTMEPISRLFEVGTLQPVRIKGKSEPVDICRVVSLSERGGERRKLPS